MPILLEARKDWNAEVRAIAEEALGKIGAVAIPEYTKALRDKDAHVRTTVAGILGRIGKEAKSAVPELMLVTKDRYGGARRTAILAIGRIDPQAADRLAPEVVNVDILRHKQSKPRLPRPDAQVVILEETHAVALVQGAHFVEHLAANQQAEAG